ncbi:MAG: hypothetical protein RBR86_04635 [Pseudobdellovibrionaceae bacterium]|jgi:hypothetical protein|nr:hypothetical protein [Pseudobdellovibrionaceae bacterium]
MVDFLKQSLSSERWKTYEDLALNSQETAESLYARNTIYSKELYVMLGGLEIVLRNTFHEQLKEFYRKEDWMSNYKLFRKSHKEQIDKATQKLSENKNRNYTIPDLISELSLGFWIHLVDAPYEQTFWIPALRHSFRNKLGPPVRQDVEVRLKQLLRLRNKIAHLEPIIRMEAKLMQAYQSSYDLISWVCPETANWFDSINDFKKVWKEHNQLEIGKTK